MLCFRCMKDAQGKRDYPRRGRAPAPRWDDIRAFALANRDRAIAREDMPAWVCESLDALPETGKGDGYRLLSADSHPDLLRQGQFMFWPDNQGEPVLAPPDARPYRHVADNRPIGIDLFAGAGGLSLGFEQAGGDVAAAHPSAASPCHHRARGCAPAFLSRLVPLPRHQVAWVPADRQQCPAAARPRGRGPGHGGARTTPIQARRPPQPRRPRPVELQHAAGRRSLPCFQPGHRAA